MKGQAGLVEVDLRVFITFLSLFTLKSYFTSLLTNFFLSIETNKKFYQQLEQIKKDSQRINEIFQDISN